MSIYAHPNKTNPEAWRVAVSIDGKLHQHYFPLDQRERAETLEQQLKTEQKKHAENRERIPIATARQHPAYRTGIKGISAKYVSQKSGKDYIPAFVVTAVNKQTGKSVPKAFRINTKNTFEAAWSNAVFELASRKNLNYEDAEELKRRIPEREIFEKAYNRMTKLGHNIPAYKKEYVHRKEEI